MANNDKMLAIRLSPEEKEKLQAAADAIGITPHTLARLAIEAGVKAIRDQSGRIAMPVEFDAEIKFQTTHVVAPRENSAGAYVLNDDQASSKIAETESEVVASCVPKPRKKRKGPPPFAGSIPSVRDPIKRTST